MIVIKNTILLIILHIFIIGCSASKQNSCGNRMSVNVYIDSFQLNGVTLEYHRMIKIDSIEKILCSKISKVKKSPMSSSKILYDYYFKKYHCEAGSYLEKSLINFFTFYYNYKDNSILRKRNSSKVDLNILNVPIDMESTFDNIVQNEIFKSYIVHVIDNYSISFSAQDFYFTFYFNQSSGKLSYLNFEF